MVIGKNLQPRILYPARLSFRFDREIKSFPDKQNLREFSATKPSFITNAKGTFLGNKHKRRKRSTENKPKTLKKMVIGCTCLFQIWFPRCVCPEVVLLGHMAVLIPVF